MQTLRSWLMPLTLVVGSGAIGCPSARPEEGPKWLGSSSCAASGCHHGNGPKGAKASEYSTWVAHDKHAKAEASLTTKGAMAIAGHLRIENPAQERRCLGCHSANVPPALRGPQLRQGDGIRARCIRL